MAGRTDYKGGDENMKMPLSKTIDDVAFCETIPEKIGNPAHCLFQIPKKEQVIVLTDRISLQIPFVKSEHLERPITDYFNDECHILRKGKKPLVLKCMFRLKSKDIEYSRDLDELDKIIIDVVSTYYARGIRIITLKELYNAIVKGTYRDSSKVNVKSLDELDNRMQTLIHTLCKIDFTSQLKSMKYKVSGEDGVLVGNVIAAVALPISYGDMKVKRGYKLLAMPLPTQYAMTDQLNHFSFVDETVMRNEEYKGKSSQLFSETKHYIIEQVCRICGNRRKARTGADGKKYILDSIRLFSYSKGDKTMYGLFEVVKDNVLMQSEINRNFKRTFQSRQDDLNAILNQLKREGMIIDFRIADEEILVVVEPMEKDGKTPKTESNDAKTESNDEKTESNDEK